MSSVRDYAILWVGARAGASGGGLTALGGNALLTAPQHALDGPEHTATTDQTRLDASVDAHGLLPKLSGSIGDVLRGDGTFGPGVSALDDLTDVVITSAAAGDRLRFDGAEWVNSALRWEPLVDYTGSVLLDGAGNPQMVEVF